MEVTVSSETKTLALSLAQLDKVFCTLESVGHELYDCDTKERFDEYYNKLYSVAQPFMDFVRDTALSVIKENLEVSHTTL